MSLSVETTGGETTVVENVEPYILEIQDKLAKAEKEFKHLEREARRIFRNYARTHSPVKPGDLVVFTKLSPVFGSRSMVVTNIDYAKTLTGGYDFYIGGNVLKSNGTISRDTTQYLAGHFDSYVFGSMYVNDVEPGRQACAPGALETAFNRARNK